MRTPDEHANAAVALTDRTEARRQAASSALDSRARATLGQYFTPAPVAAFIASLVDLPESGVLRVLDPGAGAGSLTAAVIARVIMERPGLSVDVMACEVDSGLHPVLRATLDDCMATAARAGVDVCARLIEGDYIEWAATAEELLAQERHEFDLVIMNPPYGKINKGSRGRQLTAGTTVDTPNLYAAFLALGVSQLARGGKLAAITPRSFANGSYFGEFRRYFLGRMQLDQIHVFHSRTTVFADTDVLQENVIFTATRGDSPGWQRPVTISASDGYADEPSSRQVPYSQVVHPGDRHYFIHIGTEETDEELLHVLSALPATLKDLDLNVSTGRVVDFRVSDHLRADPEPGTVPLIYPLHMQDGRVRWPVASARKSNALAYNDQTAKQTVPLGHYVVVKRLSSKEERRRVVAAVFDPEDIPCNAIAFENHVNYFHRHHSGLPLDVNRGLCLWLNSTVFDRLLRRFSGNTQVNATDLRSLRYPSLEELGAVGAAWGKATLPDQEKIDSLVGNHIRALAGIVLDRDGAD